MRAQDPHVPPQSLRTVPSSRDSRPMILLRTNSWSFGPSSFARGSSIYETTRASYRAIQRMAGSVEAYAQGF